MSGDDIRRKLLSEGYKLKDIAESMGIIPQTLNSLLKADDVKTGVLEKIAESISKSVYFFYNDDPDKHDNLQSTESRLLSIIESQQRTIENLTKK